MKPENDIFLRALKREQTEYTPIWLMRQAGRFLPEYRKVREACGSFMNLAKNPEAACEVTLQPVERFGLDAAILFSDILTVPDAMGLELGFVAGEGPVFNRPVRTEDDVRRLFVPDPEDRLRYVTDAVRTIRKALQNRVPLIGFSGSPFTLACYMVEGRGSKDFSLVRKMLYREPELLKQILEINAKAVTAYLNAQIEAGAQAVQIFDTWGGMLADGKFQEFSLSYTKKVVSGLLRTYDGERVPVILFTKGGGLWLEAMSDIGLDGVGVDWTVSLSSARQRVRDKVALQGNLDPAVLLTDDETVSREAKRVLSDFGQVDSGGHVFNLGHGVDIKTDPERVATLVDCVHECSKSYHSQSYSQVTKK